MNLLLLVIWSVAILSCTVGLPRRRQIKYPVTKFQNSYLERKNPTALEVLERTLLRPSDRSRSHSNPGRKRSARHPYRSVEVTSPMYSELAEDVSDSRKNSDFDSCVASFGAQSPLCKPKKRTKKSFIGIPDLHIRPFRSDKGVSKNITTSASNSNDDFFGIFGTKSSDAQTSLSPTNDNGSGYKSIAASLIDTSSSVPLNTSTAHAEQNITQKTNRQMEITTSQKPTSPLVLSSDKLKPVATSDIMLSDNDSRRIILPGSVQNVESEPLYIDGADNPENGFSDNEIETAEGDTAAVGEDVNTRNTRQEVTLPTLKKSLLTGVTYSKTQCQADTKKACICSFPSVDKDFQTIFTEARTEDDVRLQIAHMKCRSYSPKPASFSLNTNSKPRVLKGNHRPYAVDSQEGAKEVTAKSLDDFIAYSTHDDGVTQVFVSSNVKIPCFPKADIHLSATEADHVKYTWTFGNKKQSITQGRITEDTSGDGSLKIEDIQLTDSMNYSCEIDYIHPDTGERTTDVFVHSLSVVTLPIVSARAVVHYKSAAACDESLLEMFEMYLPQEVEKAICTPGGNRPQLCSVVVHSPVCHSESQVKAKREVIESPPYEYREKREDSMEMSLNYDVFVHRQAARELPSKNAKLCEPDCHLLINFKLLQFFRESISELALTPIMSKVQGGGTFTPVTNSLKVRYIFGCIGGYYLENGFCLACPKGMYSDDGATVCQKCPLHTYSGFVGTRKCTACKHLWVPVCNEYFESMNIKLIFFVVGGLVLLLGCFIVYYVFYYQAKNYKELFRKGTKEKIAKSQRVKSRYDSKKPKEEMKMGEKERLLHTSESEAESEPERKIKEKSTGAESSGTETTKSLHKTHKGSQKENKKPNDPVIKKEQKN